MTGFDFERLDVYTAALDFIATARALKLRLPPGNGDLADQLMRAATSIVLNIAEGTGEWATSEKARFYRMSRRSAFECAAVLDIMRKLALADETELRTGRDLLDRIGAMLTKMVAAVDGRTPAAVKEKYSGSALGADSENELPGSGAGAGSGSGPDSGARLDSDSDSDSDLDAPALD